MTAPLLARGTCALHRRSLVDCRVRADRWRARIARRSRRAVANARQMRNMPVPRDRPAVGVAGLVSHAPPAEAELADTWRVSGLKSPEQDHPIGIRTRRGGETDTRQPWDRDQSW